MWEYMWKDGDFLTYFTHASWQLGFQLAFQFESKLQTASVYPPNVAPPSRRNGPTPVGTDLKTSVPPFVLEFLPRLCGENMGGSISYLAI